MTEGTQLLFFRPGSMAGHRHPALPPPPTPNPSSPPLHPHPSSPFPSASASAGLVRSQACGTPREQGPLKQKQQRSDVIWARRCREHLSISHCTRQQHGEGERGIERERGREGERERRMEDRRQRECHQSDGVTRRDKRDKR